MKKIGLIVAVCMSISMLAGCANNSKENTSEVKEETIVEEVNNTENDVSKVESDDKKEETVDSEKSEDENKQTEEKSTTEENTKSDTTKDANKEQVTKSVKLTGVANVNEGKDGNLTVDYIITGTDGKTTYKFTEKPLFDKGWYEMYKGNGGQLFEFADFNFDGNMDIKTQQYGAMVNQYYNIRIWNESTKEFELNQDFMGISNPSINAEKKQIFGVNYDRGLGNYTLYTVKDNKLTVLAEIKAEFKDDGTFGYTQVIGTGKATPIKSVSDLDSIWKGYNIEIVK